MLKLMQLISSEHDAALFEIIDEHAEFHIRSAGFARVIFGMGAF